MNNFYDIIVIGGGPGGSTMATLMSRKGYNVLVLEKEQFPRPHVGESMLSKSYELFKELGVLDEMIKKFKRKSGVVFTNGKGDESTEWKFNKIIKDDSYLSFNVDRADFDHLLLENSKKAGASIWQNALVTDVELNNSKKEVLVKGIKEKKTEFEIRAKFLVDASGQKSFMANKLNSKVPISKESNRIAFYSYWENLGFDKQLEEGNIKIVYLDLKGGGWMWMIPVGEDRISIGVVMSNKYFQQKRKEAKGKWIDEYYENLVFSVPLLKPLLNKAKRSEDVVIVSDYSYQNTHKFGDNFATVGDASAFVDPVYSSGVYVAMKSSFLVAEALDIYLATGENLLESYYKRINGAYKIVEQLVKNYYDPNAIKINEIKQPEKSSFLQQKTALKIFYLLLTGAFFEQPEKYLETLNFMKEPKNINYLESIINKKISKKVSKE